VTQAVSEFLLGHSFINRS